VGAEVAASFPGITRLGGQIVAALYLAGEARSMDELSAELGRSKSNVFGNLRALEGAGITRRKREAGARHDLWELAGEYPDVVIGAFVARLRRVLADKRELVHRALSTLGDARGPEADGLRGRLSVLARKYDRLGTAFVALAPAADGPIDLEAMLDAAPPGALELAGRTLRAARDQAAVISTRKSLRPMKR